MDPSAAPPPARSGGGAAALRTTIIACLTADEGACIMCANCGHIFVNSRPLSDESEPIDNTVLSKALWYHLCALGRKPDRWRVAHARSRYR